MKKAIFFELDNNEGTCNIFCGSTPSDPYLIVSKPLFIVPGIHATEFSGMFNSTNRRK